MNLFWTIEPVKPPHKYAPLNTIMSVRNKHKYNTNNEFKPITNQIQMGLITKR